MSEPTLTLEQESARMRPHYSTVEDFPSLLVDDTHALCDTADFDALLDYSCSLPSGTFLGKVWKRSDAFYRGRNPDEPLLWQLAEYVPCDIPGQIGIKWRDLEVIK